MCLATWKYLISQTVQGLHRHVTSQFVFCHLACCIFTMKKKKIHFLIAQNEMMLLKSRFNCFFPLLWPSPISSFYGLFCKALKIYKIEWAWVVGSHLTNQGILPHRLFFWGSKPYRSHQKNNNHSINFAPFETFLFFPQRGKKKLQINILLVMNIQYTHPLSNEKRGQLNNTFFSL